jgi:Flp pilus assembly protein TadB
VSRPSDESVRRANRLLANASWVIGAVAIIGFIKRPDLAPLWAFMLVFAVAMVPRWLIGQLRARRARRRSDR